MYNINKQFYQILKYYVMQVAGLKKMTIEAIYIKILKLQLITRDEYRKQELTLNYQFSYKNLTFEIQKSFWYIVAQISINPNK